MTNNKVFIEGFIEFGSETQIIIAIEEFSEVTKTLTKHLRGKTNLNDMAEELAHAKIMIDQMICLFNLEKQVNQEYEKALNRLIKLLIESEDE